MSNSTESVVEDAALAWLESLGYVVLHGPEIAAGMPGAERSHPNYRDVVLEGRLRQALVRLNPDLPAEALEDAFRKLMRIDAPSLLERNRAVHRMLVDGVTVEYRRPDVVLFMNGLLLAAIELKNPADENATIWSAYQQLQTYQAQIPALFATNVALVVSDGVQARIGTLGAGKEWFKPWRTITGREDELAFYDALEVNDSAVKVLGEPTLIKIARELVATVRKNVTIDWTIRENVRAQLRVVVKRILRKYGYPPDKQEKATQTVLEQAEVLSELWGAV